MTTDNILDVPKLDRDRRTGRAWLTFVGRPAPEIMTQLKAAGWRWSGFRKAWHNPRKMVTPPVPFQVGGLVDYADERADRLDERAARTRADGQARLARVHGIMDRIPLGQPILRGHHSERRHRRDVERIESGMAKGFAALKEANRLEERADASARRQAEQDSLPGMIRRLERLETYIRRAERIGIERLTEQGKSIHADNLRTVVELRAAIKATAEPLPATDVEAGDVVRYRGNLLLVARVNAKTISGTIITGGADGWPARQGDKTRVSSTVRKADDKTRAAIADGPKSDAWRALREELTK